MDKAVAVRKNSIYLPETKDEAWQLAKSFSASSFCPKDYKGKPGDVFLAMAYGDQIGLNPLLAVQNVAVVNGRPSLYGDAMTAVAQGNPETELYEDGYRADGTAFCKIIRNKNGNKRTVEREFSEEDAKKAGLWGNNVWAKYPKRMLLWRARSWAIRDIYGDVLMGMMSFEEAQDITNTDIEASAPSSLIKNKLKMAEPAEDPVPPVVEQPKEQEKPKKANTKKEVPKKEEPKKAEPKIAQEPPKKAAAPKEDPPPREEEFSFEPEDDTPTELDEFDDFDEADLDSFFP